jgi:hypothetical protein
VAGKITGDSKGNIGASASYKDAKGNGVSGGVNYDAKKKVLSGELKGAHTFKNGHKVSGGLKADSKGNVQGNVQYKTKSTTVKLEGGVKKGKINADLNVQHQVNKNLKVGGHVGFNSKDGLNGGLNGQYKFGKDQSVTGKIDVTSKGKVSAEGVYKNGNFQLGGKGQCQNGICTGQVDVGYWNKKGEGASLGLGKSAAGFYGEVKANGQLQGKLGSTTFTGKAENFKLKAGAGTLPEFGGKLSGSVAGKLGTAKANVNLDNLSAGGSLTSKDGKTGVDGSLGFGRADVGVTIGGQRYGVELGLSKEMSDAAGKYVSTKYNEAAAALNTGDVIGAAGVGLSVVGDAASAVGSGIANGAKAAADWFGSLWFFTEMDSHTLRKTIRDLRVVRAERVERLRSAMSELHAMHDKVLATTD